MSFSLLIPAAANNQKDKGKMPFIFSLDHEGIMLCVCAIMGLPLHNFDAIYFTILKEHCEQYCLREMLELQFKRLCLKNAHVVVLDQPTSSQAETVYQTIREYNIKGSIFIKDADGFFTCEVYPKNSVTIYPLESLKRVNPQDKSYVAVDDMYYVTNIIEKKIISHYFNTGGYCFENVDDFCIYYLKLKDHEGLYLSHLIYSMLLDKYIFRPVLVKQYVDYE